MKKLDNQLGAILAAWGAIVFISTMLLFWIPMWLTILLPEPKRTRMFILLCRVWMYLFFFFSGLRLKVRGKENFVKGENYVVVCNHNSLMDVPLSSPFIPGANKTIAKDDFINVPLFGMIYKRGSVLVNRKSDQSRKESYQAMQKVLDQGLHMCIYPEGTRNRTGEPLKSFQDGAFKLAITAQKDIIPTLIFNTGKALPAGKGFYFKPMPLAIHFLEPVSISGESDPQILKEKVFRIMWDYLESRKNSDGSYRL